MLTKLPHNEKQHNMNNGFEMLFGSAVISVSGSHEQIFDTEIFRTRIRIPVPIEDKNLKALIDMIHQSYKVCIFTQREICWHYTSIKCSTTVVFPCKDWESHCTLVGRGGGLWLCSGCFRASCRDLSRYIAGIIMTETTYAASEGSRKA